MPAPEFLSVKDYQKHQHYRDRHPVWIKLYNAVMDDPEFIGLSDAERGQLMLIWLLASRRGNKIPNDARAVRRAIQASGPVHLERFIAVGFLVPYQSASGDASKSLAEASGERTASEPTRASKPLAELEQSASPHARPRARGEGETERETETEGEGEKTPPSPRAAGRKAESGRPTWLTPYAAAWKARFGGEMPIGPAATALAPLRKEHGDEELLRRWKNYLAVASPEYVNPARFASTWARWDTAAIQPMRGKVGEVEAGNIVAEIRELIFDQPIPGQPTRRLLRNADVERLGEAVHRAYRTVGGASRFLAIDGKPDDLPHLIRAFDAALQAARAELATAAPFLNGHPTPETVP